MIKKNFKALIFCIFFSIFFSNIFLLSTNLPVQDDWNNIYLLNKFDGRHTVEEIRDIVEDEIDSLINEER